jgi:hypothetical protein
MHWSTVMIPVRSGVDQQLFNWVLTTHPPSTSCRDVSE